jgi:hypothetical protein
MKNPPYYEDMTGLVLGKILADCEGFSEIAAFFR